MKLRVFIAFAAVACVASPASAHAFMKRAQPSAGAVLPAAPKSVTLAFSEKLEPAFSSVIVTDSSGHEVAAGATVIDGVSMIVPLRPLGRGTYRVTWHAVSVDTHRTEGAYSFTIKP
jgi:methionine-rich copper-binding protein CopC